MIVQLCDRQETRVYYRQLINPPAWTSEMLLSAKNHLVVNLRNPR